MCVVPILSIKILLALVWGPEDTPELCKKIHKPIQLQHILFNQYPKQQQNTI
jgi:hypothetical protein